MKRTLLVFDNSSVLDRITFQITSAPSHNCYSARQTRASCKETNKQQTEGKMDRKDSNYGFIPPGLVLGHGEGNYASSMSIGISITGSDQGLTLSPKIQPETPWSKEKAHEESISSLRGHSRDDIEKQKDCHIEDGSQKDAVSPTQSLYGPCQDNSANAHQGYRRLTEEPTILIEALKQRDFPQSPQTAYPLLESSMTEYPMMEHSKTSIQSVSAQKKIKYDPAEQWQVDKDSWTASGVHCTEKIDAATTCTVKSMPSEYIVAVQSETPLSKKQHDPSGSSKPVITKSVTAGTSKTPAESPLSAMPIGVHEERNQHILTIVSEVSMIKCLPTENGGVVDNCCVQNGVDGKVDAAGSFPRQLCYDMEDGDNDTPLPSVEVEAGPGPDTYLGKRASGINTKSTKPNSPAYQLRHGIYLPDSRGRFAIATIRTQSTTTTATFSPDSTNPAPKSPANSHNIKPLILPIISLMVTAPMAPSKRNQTRKLLQDAINGKVTLERNPELEKSLEGIYNKLKNDEKFRNWIIAFYAEKLSKSQSSILDGQSLTKPENEPSEVEVDSSDDEEEGIAEDGETIAAEAPEFKLNLKTCKLPELRAEHKAIRNQYRKIKSRLEKLEPRCTKLSRDLELVTKTRSYWKAIARKAPVGIKVLIENDWLCCHCGIFNGASAKKDQWDKGRYPQEQRVSSEDMGVPDEFKAEWGLTNYCRHCGQNRFGTSSAEGCLKRKSVDGDTVDSANMNSNQPNKRQRENQSSEQPLPNNMPSFEAHLGVFSIAGAEAQYAELQMSNYDSSNGASQSGYLRNPYQDPAFSNGLQAQHTYQSPYVASTSFQHYDPDACSNSGPGYYAMDTSGQFALQQPQYFESFNQHPIDNAARNLASSAQITADQPSPISTQNGSPNSESAPGITDTATNTCEAEFHGQSGPQSVSDSVDNSMVGLFGDDFDFDFGFATNNNNNNNEPSPASATPEATRLSLSPEELDAEFDAEFNLEFDSLLAENEELSPEPKSAATFVPAPPRTHAPPQLARPSTSYDIRSNSIVTNPTPAQTPPRISRPAFKAPVLPRFPATSDMSAHNAAPMGMLTLPTPAPTPPSMTFTPTFAAASLPFQPMATSQPTAASRPAAASRGKPVAKKGAAPAPAGAMTNLDGLDPKKKKAMRRAENRAIANAKKAMESGQSRTEMMNRFLGRQTDPRDWMLSEEDRARRKAERETARIKAAQEPIVIEDDTESESEVSEEE
jgi:hypothetical protein